MAGVLLLALLCYPGLVTNPASVTASLSDEEMVGPDHFGDPSCSQCCRDEVPQSGTPLGKGRVACMSESCTYLHGGLQRPDPVPSPYL